MGGSPAQQVDEHVIRPNVSLQANYNSCYVRFIKSSPPPVSQSLSGMLEASCVLHLFVNLLKLYFYRPALI